MLGEYIQEEEWVESIVGTKGRVGERLVIFFQAEDGIRDPLWSRGLGDVYKGQLL